MWGDSIASRVKKVINERVKSCQKLHDEHCAEVDARAEDAIKGIQLDSAISKENHAAEMVRAIIGSN